MTNESESLAAKLRSLRAKYNYTQAQVAQSLGISQQTYSNYENKNAAVDSKTLKAICTLYGVSADYLLGISQSESGADDLSFVQNDEKIMSLFADFYKKVKNETENKSEDSTDDTV